MSLLAGACGAPGATATEQSDVRSLTREEALVDFDTLVETFRAYYAPLERKQERYGFTLEQIAAEYRARVADAMGDSERFGIAQEFVARFQDAHVTLGSALASNDEHVFTLPFAVMPVANTFLVTWAEPTTSLRPGDELVDLDRVPVDTLVRRFERHVGQPNASTRRHFAAERLTTRPSYVAGGIQAGTSALVHVRHADGTESETVVAWKEAPLPRVPVAVPEAGTGGPAMAYSHLTAAVVRSETRAVTPDAPFFMTPAALASVGAEPVQPSEAGLVATQVSPAAALWAASYTYAGKKLLLVRLPDYVPASPAATTAWLSLLLREQEGLVDGLVFDQTHNPGGNIEFAMDVTSLLAPAPYRNLVTSFNADRRNLSTLLSWAQWYGSVDAGARPALEEGARSLETAYDTHQPLAPFMTFIGRPSIAQPRADYHWTKPFVMLVDELDVSCADMVPAMVKVNRMGTLFGQRTMGGGGNVELVAALPHSEWRISMTRSLAAIHDPTGAYPASALIEDVGVTPDVEYALSVDDVRGGYVSYVSAFSETLVSALR